MDLQQGKSKVVTLIPESPMATPVAVIYDRAGDELIPSGDLSPAVSTASTTVVANASNTRSSFVLTSASGFASGLYVRVTDATWGEAVSQVSAIDGTTCRLVDPLPDIPSAGSAVRGLDVTVTIPADATAELDKGFVLQVHDDDDDENVVRLCFAVVRYPHRGPCLARHVRERIARGFPGEFLKDEQFHRRVAAEVNTEIRNRLLASQNYVSAYWAPEALDGLRPAMLRWVLADRHGLREAGSTRDDYLEQALAEVERATRELLKSAQIYDADGDGAVDDTELAAKRRWTMVLEQ